MATKKTRITHLPTFDVAEYLHDERAMAEYLQAVIEDGDAGLLAAALGDIAKAYGMSEISRKTGLAREALYKAMRADAQPRFETVARVCDALGLKLHVKAA